MGKPCPKYTAEFKRRAVQLYNERGTTYAEVAREIGVDPSSLAELGQKGLGRGARRRGEPLPDGRGPAAAQARERAAQKGERDAFESERLLRRQAAVGAEAKEARFAFTLLSEGRWSVSEMCSALGVTRQGYHAWRSRGPSGCDLRDAELAGEISEVYEASRRIYKEPRGAAPARRAHVAQARGAHHARERLGRHDARLAEAPRGRGQAGSAAGQLGARPRAARLQRGRPGQGLVRRHHLRAHAQGWPCLAVVMDIWSRKIVGWSMSARMTAELADDALRMAIVRRRPPGGCIHHSDHGSQYVSLLIGKTMREAGIRPSMGSIASPWDNAAMKSLMGLVKAECVHARTFETRDQAALEIFDYIECFYNRVRIHSALGNLSPEEFEARHAQEAASAA